jgi:steroid 5-alpha reductase family enzyme
VTEALLQNAALLSGAMLALWALSVAIGKASFIDAVWGLAMAMLAVASFLSSKPGNASFLLTAMVVAWGGRLGVHLLRRYLRNGEDSRYREMLPDPDNRVAFARTALWKVFLLQGVLIMLVSSPAQVGIIAAYAEQPVPVWAWLGVALYAIGIVFEWVGDWQLARFKADPANEGKVMDSGLWRYTRHPNYFGDACVWWGIWLAAMAIAPTELIWTLPGPLFLTFTLVKWSGAAMTEDGMRKKYGAAFADYVHLTSAFVPWPPKSA